MDKLFLFSIAVVFCVDICIISAKEVGRNDVITSKTEITNHIPVDTAVNKEFHLNASGLKAARADECKCKNGRCMRMCDVEKTTPCEDQRKVCVCNPEFAKTSDDECEYCDCGQGFNCTFTRNVYGLRSTNCICPEGYYKDFYISNSKCKPECSVERPCQNGGTCSYKRCDCPWRTRGDLCQEIDDCRSKCENRLEVDCLYNERYQITYCSCKNSSLYYDQEANICKPCPCEHGFCEYKESYFYRKLVCHCHSGYKEFNGYCKECDCGFSVKGQCEFDSRGEKICNCQDGFYEREGRCLSCGCHDYSAMDTNCEVTGNVKRCFCREGFQDVNGHCEDINECETDNTCHPSATCRNTFGSFECECPDGYKGYNGRIVEPGEVCEDINECQESPSGCWFYDHVKCVNLPGSYKCECLQGYEPTSYSNDPHRTTCVRTTKHWGPSVIVLCTTLALMAVSGLMHIHVKKRAARSN